MDRETLSLLRRISAAITSQFGSNCEIVIYDLEHKNAQDMIVHIENGHVSHRDSSAGPSHIALMALREKHGDFEDKLNYLTKTSDGRILRSSTVYIRDERNDPIGIMAINYDITELSMVHSVIGSMLNNTGNPEPERIPTNVNELLDDLLEQSVRLIGRPVAMMSKDDKVRAISFLNDAGAMLITKSGDKIAKYFGISKYTLYSYLDSGSQSDKS